MSYLFLLAVAYYRRYGKHLFSLDTTYVVAIIYCTVIAGAMT